MSKITSLNTHYYNIVMLSNYAYVFHYFDTNTFWLDTNISWEQTIDSLGFDVWFSTVFYLLQFSNISTFFLVQYFLDIFDNITLLGMKNSPSLFYQFYLLNLTNTNYFNIISTDSSVQLSYQNLFYLILEFNPELFLMFYSFFSKLAVYTFKWDFCIFYNSWVDNLDVSYLTNFIFFFFLLNFFLFNTVLVFLNNYNFKKLFFFFFKKFFLYFYNFSVNMRLHFEVFFLLFFFFITWIFLILNFNDNSNDLIVIFHFFFFSFFFFIFFFFLFKISSFFFIFIESSILDSKKSAFLVKMFIRDCIGVFSFLLRFYILLFRLNVYDFLDDAYDSYYIFFCDFTEDTYSDFILISNNFYSDNKNDNPYQSNNGIAFLNDFFFTYYLFLFKFFFFCFFIVETTFRLGLAFYLCYLIIFEIYIIAGNYSEDFYIIKKLK